MRAGKPVKRSAALRTRSASAGSTFGTLRGLVFAPAQRAARSAARTDIPRRTIWRASRLRPSWSGTASTARAWPSVSSPRSTRPSTSSGSSSRRRRFETVGLALPTRSARSPSESSNSSSSKRVGASLFDRGELFACDVLDQPEQQRLAVVGVAHERRHGREPGFLRRSPAPLAGDQLEAAGRRAGARRPAGRAPASESSRPAPRSTRGRSASAAGAGSRGSSRRAGAPARARRGHRRAAPGRGRGRVASQVRPTSSIATFQYASAPAESRS